MGDFDEPFDDELVSLLDESRANEAALERSRRRWLRQQEHDTATLAGVLVDAAEQHTRLTVTTTSGRAHTGDVALLGGDFCALGIGDGTLIYVPLRAVATVSPDMSVRAVPAAGARTPARDTTFAEAVADAAGERPPATVVSQPSTIVSGTLVGVGADVATIEGERRRMTYVALSSVTEISLRTSG